MDFFNKIGDSIQNVGKEVSKKTKDITKLKKYLDIHNIKYEEVYQ